MSGRGENTIDFICCEIAAYMVSPRADFLGGGGGGDIHVVAAIVSVCKHALPKGVWGHAPHPHPSHRPPGKFFTLQPLRRFLVAPETTHRVWFVEHVSN